MLALTIATIRAPSALSISLVLAVFGFGQGLVMAPLSSVVLSTVKPLSAGSGSGMYGTTAQIANAAGVAAIGAVFFCGRVGKFSGTRDIRGSRYVRALDFDLCRIFVVDASRDCLKISHVNERNQGNLATLIRNLGDRQHTLFLFCGAATICCW